jgi:tyrosine-protein kinase Etk/Wzc
MNQVQDGHRQDIPEASPNAIDIALVLAKRKRLVLGLPVLVGTVTFVATLLLPATYTSTVRIMPPQQAQSNAVLFLAQAGVASPITADLLGVRNPSDLFIAMLKSRTIADQLIKRFDLLAEFEVRYAADAQKLLERSRTISAGKEGIITVEVHRPNPKRAADLANAHIEELEKLTLDLAVTEASQRRLFYEKHLKKVRDDLSKAEAALKTFQESSGLIKPQDQAGLTVLASSALRAQITAKQVQISTMQSFATASNPELNRAQQELAALKAELARIDNQPSQVPGDLIVPIGRVPEQTLEYIKRARDVKYYETLLEILARQYESARIDEARNATLIQVLDKAMVPEKPSGPRRSLITAISVLTALFCAGAIALLLENAAITQMRTRWRGFFGPRQST